ncbi:vWA domain-containing protein [Rubricoccus marinus]|uniref:Aerotolerance regulator BatA n=1 Tax=Rubricoccus marinus TaxID=716817 RepID=A0A259U155_9BACT|nr:VWA domain-containing protein [Rubricoccus marinus]OZC03670.1 aerotolerance regulator BatA [Rubricoccus marinus]
MILAQPFWLLLLLPIAWLAWRTWAARGRTGQAVSFPATADASGVPTTVWARLRWLPEALLLAALVLGTLAMARPQTRDASVERTSEGIDIVLALDISTSMTAEDFVPNRFEAARRVAGEFVEGRTSDRIGLVVFAARAYTQAPLTLDYRFLQRMLGEVRIGVVEDGTAIGTALATAVSRLRDSDADSKVVILLTDGQNNRGEVDPLTAAEAAEALGVRVYAIGVGGDGANQRGRLPFGGSLLGPAADVDEETLQAVARQTGGRYFRATDTEALRSIYEAIGELEKTEIEETVFLDVDEKYPLALWPALGLLALSIALSTTRLRTVP